MSHSDPPNTASTESFSSNAKQGNTQLYFENDALWQSPLLPYQRQVQQDILQAIPDDVNSILDVGCGNGVITNILPQEIRVVGLDLSEAALSQVQRETKIGSITDLPFEDNSFDLVMANDILEHLTEEQQHQALREMQRVSSGYILITVPFLEDLNVGSIRCPTCQRFYHVNHHRQSFDLKRVQKLFKTPASKNPEITCVKTILSGDRWSNDPPEIVFIKRLLGVDSSWSPHSVCLHCGHAVENENIQNEPTPRLTQFLAQLTGYLFAQSPQRRSIGFAPTEVICLFEKTNCAQENNFQKSQKFKEDPSAHPKNLPSPHSQNKGVYLNQKGQILSMEPLRFTSRYVDFRHPEIYLKNHLPHTSILPYFLSDQTSPEGVHIKSVHPVLVGFFGKLNDFHQGIELRLKGHAPSKTLLTVECYDDVFAYHSPVQVEVSGGFHLKLPMTEAAFSRYGLLFKIYATENVLLKRAKVLHVEGP
ncbi:MAG: class I SAM-dependent methyltransferase, partial [Cyanobacteria bacterium]|nr:class I SAM-dependent methyltransferase [Cyanobacteriota bacterium]